MGRDIEEIRLDLSFRYEGRDRDALHEVQGTIQKGRCVVLCGSSGCGKSTLLRCMDQLIPQFYEGTLKGSCWILGRDLSELSIGQVGSLAASVFQDPRSQFFTMNSSTEVAFGLENLGVSHEELQRRTELAFREFHLEHLQDRNVFSLSSGQRQLIAILSAWAMDTELFLLDEPTANLDTAAVEQLRELLLALKGRGKTLVISEHRLSYLSGLADEYWRICEGQVAEKLSAAEMLALRPEALRQRGLRATDLSTVEQSLPPPPPPARESHTLRAEDICFSYGRASPPVLRGVTLEACTGQVLGLIGTNGCGKTTFGRLCAGLARPTSGRFLLDGVPLRPKALREKSIFIMQESEFQFFTSSVLDELTYGLADPESRMPEIQELLQRTGLWDLRHRHPFSLSGGQMQKLALLIACLSPKSIAILDEPTAGLDYGSLQVCVELIRRMQETKLVVVITHDLELLSQVCTRCVTLREGTAAREHDLRQPGQFGELREALLHMEPPPRPQLPPKSSPPRLDPRGKLLMVAVAMIVGVWTDIPLILMCFAGVMAAALYERRWKVIAVSGGLMGGLFLIQHLVPHAAMAFLSVFLPRILLMGAAASLLLSQEEAPRTLAALRKLHVPEKLIMIFSVSFRFFPVLSLDLGIMSEALKTRGAFPTLGAKLRAIPAYVEVLIVPMVFRVIRIAESLSASAETRGISLPGRRDSFYAIEAGPWDGTVLALFLVCVSVGLYL